MTALRDFDAHRRAFSTPVGLEWGTLLAPSHRARIIDDDPPTMLFPAVEAGTWCRSGALTP